MNINELHDHLFEYLCILDDILSKHHIRYFLDGGTELGSVREKDFIAWDDDIDLKIFAEDWPAFYRIVKAELPPYLKISLPEDSSPYYYDLTIRIYDERYLLHTETEEDRYYRNLQNHVGIDVFLLAKTPVGKLPRTLYDIRNRMIYGYGIAHRYMQKTENYSFKEKLQVSVLRALGRRYTAKEICAKWLKHVNKHEKLEKCMRYAANWPLDDIRFIPGELYDTTAYGTIRGRNFPIPGRYDEELTIMYGDWKTPRKDFKENGKPFLTHLEQDS